MLFSKWFYLIGLLFILVEIPIIHAENRVASVTPCRVLNSQNQPVQGNNDALFHILNSEEVCPQNVRDLKNSLLKFQLKPNPSMVANRGRHNSELGSFSFFESVSGDLPGFGKVEDDHFFFGHFLGADNNVLKLDQTSESGKLMIELIVWDNTKKYYNFYELIGTGTGAQWFYRGDSKDALLDNALLFREVPDGQKRFGNRMRCSGCHTTGEPIMKEIATPHNDWWTKERLLPTGVNTPDEEVQAVLNELMDASDFSDLVKKGMDLLQSSTNYQNVKLGLTLQELFRPLFSETEINIESDLSPIDDSTTTITIPSAFFMNPLLADDVSITISKKSYLELLAVANSKFPEINRQDADHAWLVPVKGLSDLKAIEQLVNRHQIDEKFMYDVLTIDLAHPLFSNARTSLLRFLPQSISPDWKEKLVSNLSAAVINPELPETLKSAASELLANMTDLKRTVEWHKARILDRKSQIIDSVTSPSGLKTVFRRLINDRTAVFKSQISQNPRGQILEPGFRVIFPEAKLILSRSGQFSSKCAKPLEN
jgi:hypothetical protein